MASLHLQNTNVSFSWPCPLTKTKKRSAHSTCAKEFAKEHEFQLIETSDDGNCFFYTLTKFAKRAGYEPFLLDSNEHRNAMALRQLLVDHIQDNFHQYADFLFNNNNAGTINEQVEDLRRNGAWASEAGDLVPMAAVNAFGIHINLYNIEDRGDHDVIQLVPIRSSSPSSVYVSIMRVREGHFQLLWPRSGVFQSISSSLPSSSLPSSSSSSASLPSSATQLVCNSLTSHQDVLVAAHSAVKAAGVAVSAAKKVAPSSSSLSQNEQALNEISRNLNQLSLGTSGSRRSTRSTRSSKPKSPPRSPKKRSSTRKRGNNGNASFYVNNNNNLQRAINESMRYQ